MQHFYHQIIMQMYLLDQNMIQQNEYFVVIKTLSWIYHEINQRVLNYRYHFFSQRQKLSLHMAQISGHINSSNHNVH